jgi:dephospho-CoA kinase
LSAVTVGLTGGIGSGKSTAARMLESKGAVLIDADAIAREVVAPDGPAYGPVVERFGGIVVAPDGTIDRKALAEIVFHDAQALADLNAATHPVIGQVMVERRAAAERAGAVVVMDIPLLKATHREQIGFDVVVVVDTPVDMAVQRLVDERGFDRTDAEARLAAQITREERRALADVVLDNGGDIDALQAQVDRLWSDLRARAVPAP